MSKRLLLILLLSVPILATAQRRKNKYKYEWVYGVGATNLLSDLGGANQIGTHFVKDFEFNMTRPAIMIGFRYKNSRRVAYRANLITGILSAEDRLTKEPFRENRNLSVRTPIIELSGQFEYYFTKEHIGHLYKIKNAKGYKKNEMHFYAFVGVGAFFFQPKARYNKVKKTVGSGDFVNLQPLGTEGQGLGSSKKYSRINICIPHGLGVKYSLNKKWSIGLEGGSRKTFSDYIDDTHGVYYDPAEFYKSYDIDKATMVAKLANPSLASYPKDLAKQGGTGCQTCPGEQRGEIKYTDTYMFLILNVNYKVQYKSKTRSKF